MRKFAYNALGIAAVLGLLLALWPLGQTAYGRWSQRTLQRDWETAARQAPPETAPAPPARPASIKRAGVEATPTPAPRPKNRKLPPWPATRLVIPDLHLDVVVVQGIDPWDLQRGPGHNPTTAGPGQVGNCVIAGHRNIFGSWFYKLDQLLPGAEIKLITPRHTHTYRTLEVTTATDGDITLMRPPDDPNAARLTLITCTMPHSSNRVVLKAYLFSSE